MTNLPGSKTACLSYIHDPGCLHLPYNNKLSRVYIMRRHLELCNRMSWTLIRVNHHGMLFQQLLAQCLLPFPRVAGYWHQQCIWVFVQTFSQHTFMYMVTHYIDDCRHSHTTDSTEARKSKLTWTIELENS